MDVSSGAAVAALLLDDYDVNRSGDCNHGGRLEQRREGDKCKDSSAPTHDSGASHETSGGTVDTDDARPKPPSIPESIAGAPPPSAEIPFRVLDLCCAPGLKTCAIADVLSTGIPSITPSPSETHERRCAVVGVDISPRRINLCRSIVTKYHVDPRTSAAETPAAMDGRRPPSPRRHAASVSIRLYRADGTTFGGGGADGGADLVFDSDASREAWEGAGTRRRRNKSARARERKRLRQISLEVEEARVAARVDEGGETGREEGTTSFDRVIVDAECGTDGAVCHLQHKRKRKLNCKNLGWGEECSTGEVEDCANNNGYINTDRIQVGESSDVSPSRLDVDNTSAQTTKFQEDHTLPASNQRLYGADLALLQRQLIASGFRLLKEGGSMVYSTCSLFKEQNEDIVSWLLRDSTNNRDGMEAFVIPVSFFSEKCGNAGGGWDSGRGTNGHDSVKIEEKVISEGMISEGFLPGTVRFLPFTANDDNSVPSHSAGAEDKKGDLSMYGGGFFLAKIGKRRVTKLL